jgi:hypothetical protein
VGPRADLDAVVKRKIPSPRRESNPSTLIVQPVAQRYADWAITALILAGTNKNVYLLEKSAEVLNAYKNQEKIN